jgi:hypothetical protein
MTYSAYLGGRMVYEHGVGVRPADGLREEQAPEIHADNVDEVARLAAQHVKHGAQHAWEHLRKGEIAPSLAPYEGWALINHVIPDLLDALDPDEIEELLHELRARTRRHESQTKSGAPNGS